MGCEKSNIPGRQVLEKQVVAKQEDCKTYNDNYQCIFEQATDAIMVTDFNGNFIDVNSALCSMFGYTKEELLQLNIRALLDEQVLKIQPLRFDLLAAGENIFNERKMLHKNGTVVYVEANAKKCTDNCILVIARDITERKKADWILQKSEANLHTIFDTTDTIYVLMDTDLQIISFNPRAVDFAKFELGHSIKISEHFLDYFAPAKRPLLKSYMSEVLTGKRITYEVSYPQTDGSFHWYHVRMFPISNGDPNVYGLMVAVSDITEKIVLEQRLEEERIKKQQEITDAVITAEENERQEIGRELHDNVNQILVSSLLYLSMAKKTELREQHPNIDESVRLITMAIEESRNLSHSLIAPFLEDHSFINALDHLIKTISNVTRLTINRELKGVDENTIPEKLKLAIYRIIQEQFNNIIKYAKARTIQLTLIQVNTRILLSIKDDGKGFDTSNKPTGMGLMNIRTRASLFNGEVGIISAVGNGCELTVKFN